MNILEKIIVSKREEIARRKRETAETELRRQAETVSRPVHSFRNTLENSATGIIAEFKRKSPSKGFIHPNAVAAEIVSGYEAAGAAAVSVLTDTEYFGGSPDDLREARKAVSLPLLRKDFIIDPYQLYEARIWGADVVLLIAAALTPERTAELAEEAHRLGMEVLLEIHEAAVIEHLNPCVYVAGINNRNLGTFVTDIQTSFELGNLLPDGLTKISESGLSDPRTIRELRRAGFRGFLMGENFMKHEHPAAALETFLEAL